MLESLILFLVLALSILLVFKSADYATKYSTKVARGLLLPQYVIGFFVVAVIGILPEGLFSVSAAMRGLPSLGLGTIFGSNIADLTLIISIVILFSGRELRADKSLLKTAWIYFATMASPILFGLDGRYSRAEGVALIVIGLLFSIFVLKNSRAVKEAPREGFSIRDIALLVLSMIALLIGAYSTVEFSVDFAESLRLSPIIIGMFVVALGTTLPELFFSLRAAKHRHDNLALGDILGTVMVDATVVIGLIAAISPFSFDQRMVYVAGIVMLISLVLLFSLMKSGRIISKKEALILLLFYLIFAGSELFIALKSDNLPPAPQSEVAFVQELSREQSL